MDDVYYQATEKVRIVDEQALDYVIEDLGNGRTYVMDKTYFHKHYEALFKLDDYSTLKSELYKQAAITKQLRRANSKQKNEIRSLRRQLETERRKQNSKQHYKNGKRGTVKNG